MILCSYKMYIHIGQYLLKLRSVVMTGYFSATKILMILMMVMMMKMRMLMLKMIGAAF